MSGLCFASLDRNRGGRYRDTGKRADHDCCRPHRMCLHQTRQDSIDEISAFHCLAFSVGSYTVVVKDVRTNVVIEKLVTPRRGEDTSGRDKIWFDCRDIKRRGEEIGALNR